MCPFTMHVHCAMVAGMHISEACIVYLCLRLQALPEGISRSLYNCLGPSLAACHLQEVVVAARCDILPIAADSAIKLVKNAVILVQVAQLQQRTCFQSHFTGRRRRQDKEGYKMPRLLQTSTARYSCSDKLSSSVPLLMCTATMTTC